MARYKPTPKKLESLEDVNGALRELGLLEREKERCRMNVVAPNNTENAPRLTAIVARWNFDKAVERLRPKVRRWTAVTAELTRELYIAREYLNGQKGQRKDPEAADYIRYTWSDFCEAIGMSRQTANKYLNRFLPAELSENGEDRLLSPEEAKALAASKLPATTREQENLIASFMAPGGVFDAVQTVSGGSRHHDPGRGTFRRRPAFQGRL
ncbi:MAG: hypothetical protein LBP29_09585 [Treponema sp.]|jgi:hypothetical protein|nr:hypothetical protein [Treponema sp.]